MKRTRMDPPEWFPMNAPPSLAGRVWLAVRALARGDPKTELLHRRSRGQIPPQFRSRHVP